MQFDAEKLEENTGAIIAVIKNQIFSNDSALGWYFPPFHSSIDNRRVHIFLIYQYLNLVGGSKL